MNRLGIHVYGLAALMLGAVGLVFDDFALVWQPVPAGLPGRAALAYVVAALFVAAGIAANLPRWSAWGAGALALLYGLGALLLHVPDIVLHSAIYVSWSGLGEQLALTAGGAIAYAAATGDRRMERISRCVFGVCLISFGGAHFAYPTQTAAMVPDSLWPSQLFWAYATGVAHIAAGLAILSGRLARPAAVLITVMFVLFQFLVHIPVLLCGATHVALTMNAINLGLVGAAWIVAESLFRAKPSV